MIKEYIKYNKKMYLDVVQLMKHGIGLLKKSGTDNKKPLLVYIYWRPKNFAIFDNYKNHDIEIKKFSKKINQFLEFKSLAYDEFWDIYITDNTLANHFKKVKERYYIEI